MANKRNKRRSSRARSCPDALVNQLEGLNLERDSAEEVYNGPDWGMYEQIDREMELKLHLSIRFDYLSKLTTNWSLLSHGLRYRG